MRYKEYISKKKTEERFYGLDLHLNFSLSSHIFDIHNEEPIPFGTAEDTAMIYNLFLQVLEVLESHI